MPAGRDSQIIYDYSWPVHALCLTNKEEKLIVYDLLASKEGLWSVEFM